MGIFLLFGDFRSAWGCDKNAAARSIFFALFALQHRGQESTGIATLHHTMHLHRGMGLVSQVFTEEVMDTLKGEAGIGHTRYSTAGHSQLTNAQPFVLETGMGQMALAHNGQLTLAGALRKRILSRGTGLHTTTDSELVAQMLSAPLGDDFPSTPGPVHLEYERDGKDVDEEELKARAGAGGRRSPVSFGDGKEDRPPTIDTWEGRLARFVCDAEGAYSFVLLTRDAVYGVRDRHGIRPLCIGRRREPSGKDALFLSSESCALGTVGAEFVREVAPGEVVRLNDDGISSLIAMPSLQRSIRPSLCIFEYIYFARPDSILEQQLVHTVRQRLGKKLAEIRPVESADIVSGVPDSSIPAAIGYSTASGKPFMEVFCKNRYIGRTFIHPDDTLRRSAIHLKFNALSHNVAGRSVVLIDDSIVRGNTLRKLVPLLREAGAKEVHLRISSPPIRHPCYMGVNIGTYEELIAHAEYAKLEEGADGDEAVEAAICRHIGADSLAYLSPKDTADAIREGMDEAIRNLPGKVHCDACFTGDYPLPVEAVSW